MPPLRSILLFGFILSELVLTVSIPSSLSALTKLENVQLHASDPSTTRAAGERSGRGGEEEEEEGAIVMDLFLSISVSIRTIVLQDRDLFVGICRFSCMSTRSLEKA